MERPLPVKVLQSFPTPRATTNPYIVMLAEALRATPGVEIRTFSWRDALLGQYDVFHAHWPENLVTGRTRLRTWARQLLFRLLLVRLRIRGVAVVRTQHNLELPSGLSRAQVRLLRRFEGLTSATIALNRDTPALTDTPCFVIPHGHYRAWFMRFDRPARISGRIAYFGLIRRYKNVEALVRAFRQLAAPATLVVAGSPSSSDLRDGIERAAAGDERISLILRFQSEEEVAAIASEAQLVVLPYLRMHNSGGALAALSLDAPVLVPRNPTNEALAAEVGADWVQMYEGELDAAALLRALTAVAGIDPDDSPDLSGRDWDGAGLAHLEAYRAAIGRRSQRRYSR